MAVPAPLIGKRRPFHRTLDAISAKNVQFGGEWRSNPRARFETDSKRADFLRSFGLATLPKESVICTRAGEMLLAQGHPEQALTAVNKALVVDPTALSAQRLRLRILDVMPK